MIACDRHYRSPLLTISVVLFAVHPGIYHHTRHTNRHHRPLCETSVLHRQATVDIISTRRTTPRIGKYGIKAVCPVEIIILRGFPYLKTCRFRSLRRGSFRRILERVREGMRGGMRRWLTRVSSSRSRKVRGVGNQRMSYGVFFVS